MTGWFWECCPFSTCGMTSGAACVDLHTCLNKTVWFLFVIHTSSCSSKILPVFFFSTFVDTALILIVTYIFERNKWQMELTWRWVSTIVCTCLGAGRHLPGNLLSSASSFTLSFDGNNCNKIYSVVLISLSETLCNLGTQMSNRFQVVSVFFQYTFQGFFPVPLNSQLLCEMLF